MLISRDPFEVKWAYVSIFEDELAGSRRPAAGWRHQACQARSSPRLRRFGMNVFSAGNPVIEQEPETAQDLDLPWQVVVHNDPVNLMNYVTMVFQKVFGFTRERAEKHMLEVHRDGRSIVWSGMRERAELYVQQLHGYLLLATLERVN